MLYKCLYSSNKVYCSRKKYSALMTCFVSLFDVVVEEERMRGGRRDLRDGDVQGSRMLKSWDSAKAGQRK